MLTKEDHKPLYVSPVVQMVPIHFAGVLCLSGGTNSMYEKDYAGGGFA